MSTNPKSRRGFSLVEVTIALTILALISGSIFAVLSGTVEVTAGIRETQVRQQQIDGFLELCRNSFRKLPGQADLESRIRQSEGKAYPEIIFRNTPNLFAWGATPDLNMVSVLGLKAQIGGNFSLALLRVTAGNDSSKDPVSSARPADWLVLVPDVRTWSWRFFDSQSKTWREILPKNSPRPEAAELVLNLADQPDPIRAVFKISPLLRMAGTSFPGSL